MADHDPNKLPDDVIGCLLPMAIIGAMVTIAGALAFFRFLFTSLSPP
jgi:hypothetical protein